MKKCIYCGQFDGGRVFSCKLTVGHKWENEDSVKTILKQHQRWLDAEHTSNGQRSDSATVIELCNKIKALKEDLEHTQQIALDRKKVINRFRLALQDSCYCKTDAHNDGEGSMAHESLICTACKALVVNETG